MDAGARHWLLKTARSNYWRVAAWYDLDDLIQDGYLKYWWVRRRYPQARDPKHIMRLFQMTYLNHIHDLSKKRTACLETLADDLGLVDVWSVIGGIEEPTTEVIACAPSHLQRVLRAYELGDPRLRAPYRRRTGRQRETLNQRLCRIAGINPDDIGPLDYTSIPMQLRQLLSSS